ncbi:MAG: hypothetical protein ACFFDN_51125, partial [Candidatus Hodarchaeota archaeon]
YPHLKKIILEITDHWLNNKFFLKYHLFPFRYSDDYLINFLNLLCSRLNRYSSRQPYDRSNKNIGLLINKLNYIYFTYFTSGMYVQLMKSNTTFIFTLIDLYRRIKKEKYKDTVIIWINSVIEKMVEDGIVYGFYYPSVGKKYDNRLLNSFIFIDVLMDSFYFIRRDNKYLELTKEIIDKRLADRWKNGLIPWYFNGKYTHIDSLVDFSISIRRYAELSGDASYLDYSYELLKNTLKFHYSKKGYYLNIKRNDKPLSIKISPKYNGLLLKGIINLLTINENMYENLKLHDILKDR